MAAPLVDLIFFSFLEFLKSSHFLKSINPLRVQGFVDCPICSRSVPSFYINSHVDQCLISTSENLRSHKVVQKKSSDSVVQNEKLTVPPKLVPTLVSEKSLRMALRKYGLPSEGRKPELLERYNRMRLAVETANDKGEAVSYAKLAHKVMAQERQRAVASLLVQTDNINGSLAKPGALHVENTTIDKELDVGENRDAYVVGPGTSFKELIAITKARDAARKRERNPELN
jgi:hypothetical protein